MRFTILVFALLFIPSLLLAQDLYVEVRSSKVREKPLHWAKGLEDVSYGDKLSFISFSEPWYNVKTSKGNTGYIHATAVTKKVIVFKGSGTVDKQVSQSDIVLAGKGFNKDIEQRYAGDTPSLNYGEVNKMETKKVSAGKLAKFIRDGKLNSEGVHTHAAQYAKN